jgi:hypothetical protein
MSRQVLLMSLAAVALVLVALAVPLIRGASVEALEPAEKWEYLIVAGGTMNTTPTTDSSLRKVRDHAFRESFVVEKNLDRLGAQGWELVAVIGSPSDPVYHLKRRK